MLFPSDLSCLRHSGVTLRDHFLRVPRYASLRRTTVPRNHFSLASDQMSQHFRLILGLDEAQDRT